LTASRRILAQDDLLPLTCTRSGTCCHGKDIRITPWELAVMAKACGLTTEVFQRTRTADGGTRLAMHGASAWRGLRACTMYDPASGCTVHPARPLACRLYPLGRERQGERVRYMHEGRRFPCLDGCPDVETLPRLTVGAYLASQAIAGFDSVRDAYLEIAQDVAEGAFVLVFDSGLAQSGNTAWQQAWRQSIHGGVSAWVASLGEDWHARVMTPPLALPLDDGVHWASAHADLLQSHAQSTFAALRDPDSLSVASTTMLAAALLLLHAVGGDAPAIGGRWLSRAIDGV
jgi:uncharacterized protein